MSSRRMGSNRHGAGMADGKGMDVALERI